MDTLQADLTETLYSILLGEADWSRFLAQLVSDRSAGAAIFMLQNDSQSGRNGSLEIAVGLESPAISAYAEYYSQLNPWVPDHVLLAQRRGVADHEVISREELHRTEYYNDYLQQVDIEGSAGLNLSRRGGETMLLTTVFADQDPIVATRMAARLELLKPRLMRVLDHYRRREAGAAGKGFAGEALEVLGTGLCLIDDGQKPVMISGPAEQAARQAGLFRLSPTGRISFADARAQQALRDMLSRDRNNPGEVIWHQNGYRLTLFRAAYELVSELLCGPMAGLIIEPEHRRPGGAELVALQQRFGLTPAEMRVLSGVAEGLSIRGMASEHMRSPETVRSQVKSLLHKTGCENQIALLHLLRSGR